MATFEFIAKTVLSSTTSTIVVSSIPNTYTDLYFLASLRGSANNENTCTVTFNSTSLSNTVQYGQGTSSGALLNATTFLSIGLGHPAQPANTFGTTKLYIHNYASTTKNKSANVFSCNENNSNAASSAFINHGTGIALTTSAINSITFTPGSGSFVSGSSIYVYGISNA
jgi:hypothetical protein